MAARARALVQGVHRQRAEPDLHDRCALGPGVRFGFGGASACAARRQRRTVLTARRAPAAAHMRNRHGAASWIGALLGDLSLTRGVREKFSRVDTGSEREHTRAQEHRRWQTSSERILDATTTEGVAATRMRSLFPDFTHDAARYDAQELSILPFLNHRSSFPKCISRPTQRRRKIQYDVHKAYLTFVARQLETVTKP